MRLATMSRMSLKCVASAERNRASPARKRRVRAITSGNAMIPQFPTGYSSHRATKTPARITGSDRTKLVRLVSTGTIGRSSAGNTER